MSYVVEGHLHPQNGAKGYGKISLKKLETSKAWETPKRYVWEQRSLCDNTRHLKRDYICGETFDGVAKWLMHDWLAYTIEVEEKEVISSTSETEYEDNVYEEEVIHDDNTSSASDDGNEYGQMWR